MSTLSQTRTVTTDRRRTAKSHVFLSVLGTLLVLAAVMVGGFRRSTD